MHGEEPEPINTDYIKKLSSHYLKDEEGKLN
jgi:hypothetical protein